MGRSEIVVEVDNDAGDLLEVGAAQDDSRLWA